MSWMQQCVETTDKIEDPLYYHWHKSVKVTPLGLQLLKNYPWPDILSKYSQTSVIRTPIFLNHQIFRIWLSVPIFFPII